jgi:hypothetical protein
MDMKLQAAEDHYVHGDGSALALLELALF